MNFGFNEEQELLRSTARKFFENEVGSDTVRRLMETPEGMTPELWTKLAEQGWLGLVFPDQYDGMGLGLVDLVVLMEEMGRAVVPGPYFSAVLLGGLAIREAGSEAPPAPSSSCTTPTPRTRSWWRPARGRGPGPTVSRCSCCRRGPRASR